MRQLPPLVLTLLLAAVLAGCSSPTKVPEGVDAADCVGHRHVTFAVAMPGADGNLQRLDLAEPRDNAGRPYYQLGIASNQDMGLHMHQSGAEAGAGAVPAHQLHMEADGCIDIADGLGAVDVTASAEKLTVAGKHARAGSWQAADGQAVHVYLQAPAASGGRCAWTWSELGASGLTHVLADGEAFLVLFGDPGAGNVAVLQDGIPAPVSRSPSPTCD